MSGLSFGFWIAVAAIIFAAGRHLDANYIGNPAREWARMKLISAFHFLERPLLSRLFGERAVFFASFLFTAFYTWVVLWEASLPPDVLHSLFPNQDPKVTQTALLLACSLLTLRFLRYSLSFAESQAESARQRRYSDFAWRLHAMRVGATRFTLGISPIAYAIAFVSVTRDMPPYDIVVSIAIALFASAQLYILLFIIYIALSMINYTIIFSQRIARHVFRKASSPTTSPFTYFADLLSLGVLIAKAVQEYAKST